MSQRAAHSLLLAAALLLRALPAGAQAPEEQAELQRGRAAFARGLSLYHEHKYGDAVVALREAAAARDNAVIQFNIALCERALGHYVEALRALNLVARDPAGLDADALEEARERTAEMASLIVRLAVSVQPAGAALSVDSRSLESVGEPDSFATAPATRGGDAAPAAAKLTLWLNPGVHIFRASRPGHADALINRTYQVGEHTSLELLLDRLPATLRVESTPHNAIVRIDGLDVGSAPVEVQRAAGRYTISSLLPGFEDFETTVNLTAGERRTVATALKTDEPHLLTRWWFWVAAAAVVGGAGAVTFWATRPDTQPQPYDAGNTGWLVDAR
jgi:hypothetical protein